MFQSKPDISLIYCEPENTNCIVFDLTGPGIEPTIYTTGGDYINHSTTDAVWDLFNRL